MSQKKAQLLNPLGGNINVTGVITASSFSGDGSGLTGVASTDNIQTATEATFLSGVKITGVTTASGGVVGNLTGNVTGTASNATLAVNAQGLTGTPNITVGSVTADSGSFSGNVTIGGTLTYQDVEHVDSVGIITAQQGIQVLANGLDVTGFSTFNTGVSVTGVVTATSLSGNVTGNVTGELVGAAVTTSSAGLQASNVDFAGILREQVTVTAGKLSDNTNINLDNGMAHLFTTTETTTSTPNIMSGTGINTDVQIGEAFSVSIITTAAAAGYAATVHIDGVTVGTNGGSLVWNGGSAPSAGGDSGKDLYSYSIVKTASATYTVLANVTNFA
jgi:hypothetical protein